MTEPASKYTAGFSYENSTMGYQLGFYSEVFDGKLYDTEVCIDPDESNGVSLCMISGDNIEEFDKEFTALITKYRI